MLKFTRFIKDNVLPDNVDKERRKKIFSEGVIETWTSDEHKKAKEIIKTAYKRIRSGKINEHED